MKKINGRVAEHDILDMFLERHSPRAMAGVFVSRDELMTLFESARWAPSAGNVQPWRFLYAIRGTSDFDLFLSFLVEGNRAWAHNAGALIIGLSKRDRETSTGEIKPNPTHSFDTGAAWENLALQGSRMGLVVHGMNGYHEDMVRKELHIQENYAVEVMIAIGHPGRVEDLPEKYRERETPSQRKSLSEIAFEGRNGAQSL